MRMLRWPLEEVFAATYHRLVLRAEADEHTSCIIEAVCLPYIPKSQRSRHEVHPLLRDRDGR